MARRTLLLCMLALTLALFSTAHSGINFTANSSLDSFSYELDHIHLQLEKVSVGWQLLPTAPEKLEISQLKAKRLTITTNNDLNTKGSAFPDRIRLPFDINIKRAEIAEIIIIQAGEHRTFHHVVLNFEGNSNMLNLNLLQADSEWGNVQANLTIQTAKPFKLNGWTSLKQTESDSPWDIKALISGNLDTIDFKSSGVILHKQASWQIAQSGSDDSHTIAQIEATGKLDLSCAYPITINAKVSDFNFKPLSENTSTPLNNNAIHLNVNLQGNLQLRPIFNIKFESYNSTWQDQALKLNGLVTVDDDQIKAITFSADAGNNHLQANGSLGESDSRLTWQTKLENLKHFNSELSGSLQANGLIEGAKENLKLRFSLLAEQLVLFEKVKINTISGEAELAAQSEGKVTGAFKLNDIRYRDSLPLNATLSLNGTRNVHALTFAAQNQTQQFESTLQGGLNNDFVWQGLVQSLAYKFQALSDSTNTQAQEINIDDKKTITLKHPVPLNFNAEGLKLQNAILQSQNGHINIKHLEVNNNGLTSDGLFEKLNFQDLPFSLHNLPENVQGTLAFSGTWDINTHNNVNGRLSLWQDGGSLTFTDHNNINQPLKLDEAKAEIAVADNKVTLTAAINAEKLGRIKVVLNTEISKTVAGYVLQADAPLILNSSLQLQSFAWIPLPSTLRHADFNGQLDLVIQANGTLSTPNLTGYLKGKDLQLTLISEGVALKNGSIEGTFEENQLRIKQASWQGGEGYLNATGTLSLDNRKPAMDLNWSAKNFTVISRADRLLTLNGAGKSTLADNMLTILGRLDVEKGLIELVDESTPTLGDDVELVGVATSETKSSLQILLNGLHIDLGKDFTLRGQGINAQLTGAVTLTGLTQYHPHTEGSIQVKQGTYMAYGQVLNIERGIFNFSGPMDNPGLNIRAMRNSKPVNAGVEITGNAFLPTTKLVSDPDVPDSEKLSWLVLGHGMDKTGKNDYAVLSLAAGALLSQGQSIPLQTQLARAAGLDEFSFAGGDAESASLTFGKRLTSRLYLSYAKSISGLLDIARLTFNITPRWSLRAEAGNESAVDVLYTFSFK